MEGGTAVLHPFSLGQIGADPWIRAFLNEKPPVIPPPRAPEPVLEPQPSPLHDKRLIESGITQLDLRSSQDTALTALRKAPQITQGIVEFALHEHPNIEFDDELDAACAAVHPAKVLMNKRDAKKAEEHEGDMPLPRVLPMYLNESKLGIGFTKPPPIVPPPAVPVPVEAPKKVSALPPEPEAPKREPSPPPKPVVILTPPGKNFEKKKAVVHTPPEPKITLPPLKPAPPPPEEQDLNLSSEAEGIVDIPVEEEEEVPPPKPVVKKTSPKAVKMPAVKPKSLPPPPEPKPSPKSILKPKPFVEEEEVEEDESAGPDSEIEGEETDVGDSEPSDGESIEDGDDEDAEADDEADYTEEKKAKTKAVVELVKMSYEKRFANVIAEVNEKFDAKESKKRKTAEGKEKQSKPKKVQFTEATPENKPIGVKKTPPVPAADKAKGVPTIKTAASLRKTLDECNAHSTFPRIVGTKTKLSPLDPIPVDFQKMFEGCWEDSVCLAIVEKWPQPKSSPFWTYGDHGVELEKLVLDYVNVKSLNVEAAPESAILQRWHRMIWAYERMHIFVPPVLLDDSKCEIILEKPMPNQNYFTEPARKITCFYIQLPAFQAMRDAIRPYEFCRREARIELDQVVSLHQGEITADFVYQKLLTNPTTNRHRVMLYSWFNAQLLAELNFFSDD
jgi:hypothetical protein